MPQRSCKKSHNESRKQKYSVALGFRRTSGQLVLQCLCEGLFPTLLLLLHQKLKVSGPGVVDAALRLVFALPATSALIFALSHRLRRVPVTHALVAPIQELIVGHVVLADVLTHLIKGPVGQRVDLNQARFVNLQHIEIAALPTLAAATTRENGTDVELAVSALGRLHFGSPVVELLVGLPEALAVLLCELLCRLDAGGLEDVNVDVRVPFTDPINQPQGLGEMVQRVQENEVDELRPRNLQLRQHVGDHQPRQAKGGGLIEVGQRSNAPSEDVCKEC